MQITVQKNFVVEWVIMSAECKSRKTYGSIFLFRRNHILVKESEPIKMREHGPNPAWLFWGQPEMAMHLCPPVISTTKNGQVPPENAPQRLAECSSIWGSGSSNPRLRSGRPQPCEGRMMPPLKKNGQKGHKIAISLALTGLQKM